MPPGLAAVSGLPLEEGSGVAALIALEAAGAGTGDCATASGGAADDSCDGGCPSGSLAFGPAANASAATTAQITDKRLTAAFTPHPLAMEFIWQLTRQASESPFPQSLAPGHRSAGRGCPETLASGSAAVSVSAFRRFSGCCRQGHPAALGRGRVITGGGQRCR